MTAKDIRVLGENYLQIQDTIGKQIKKKFQAVIHRERFYDQIKMVIWNEAKESVAWRMVLKS